MSLEDRKFEDEWKQAFADAEGDVNQSVWTNIDAKLANAESGAMKKRVLFYQWLAAASVVLAMVAGGFLLLQTNAENQRSISTITAKTEKAGDSSNLNTGNPIELSPKRNSLSADSEPASSKLTTLTESKATFRNNAVNTQAQQTTKLKVRAETKADLTARIDKANEITSVATNRNDESQKGANANIHSETSVTPIAETTSQVVPSELKSRKATIAASEAILQVEKSASTADTTRLIESPIKIAQNNPAPEPETQIASKEEPSENWWASLNGSAGSYTTGSATGSPALQSNTGGLNFQNGSTGTTNARAGTAFSYGVNVGKRIAPRWVIMSGIGYMTQSINYPSSSAVFSFNQAQAFMADISRTSASPSVSVASYELTSVNEFVTIPLQAGYLLVNQKVGLQLNAGIASDLFLRNTLSDPAGTLSSNSQSAGESSTYKTVNWSGLVGTELSYRISTHYRISVIPGMRYSFGSILKSNVNGSLTPLIWDVGFRFKYIF